MRNDSLRSRNPSSPAADRLERYILLCAGLLLVFMTGCATQIRGQEASAQKVLHNEQIVSLTKAGLSDAAIISVIRKSRTEFDLSAEALVSLRQAGVTNAVIEAMLGSLTLEPPATAPSQTLLPATFGYYVIEGGQLRSIQTVPIRTVIGLSIGRGEGWAVDGVAGEPNFSLKDQLPAFIVYQQSVDIQMIHFSTLTFVSSMQAYEFIPPGAPGSQAQFFRAMWGRDYYDSITINLWRPKTEVLFKIEPAEGKSGMFKLTPMAPLMPGRYAAFFGETMHRNGMIFAKTRGNSNYAPYALYFEVVERSLTAGSRTTSGTISGPTERKESTAGCSDYNSCLKSGNNALQSSQWDQALTYFQKASSLEPTKPDAWAAMGRVYLASGQYGEVPGMWDKALQLGGTLVLDVWHTRGLSFERGTFRLNASEVSFLGPSQEKILSVAPPEISSHGSGKLPLSSASSFGLRATGKNYRFYSVPVGLMCASPVRCQEPGPSQQAAVARYIDQTISKLASGGLVASPPPTPQPTTNSTNSGGGSAAAGSAAQPASSRRISEQVRNVIASYEKTGGFHSPLNDEQFLQLIVGESEQTGIAPWLLFGQARFETTFGDPVNATTRDGVTFKDGSTGNAHNLFNIRPGVGWKGKVLDTGRGGQFRVYDSYEDSIRHYLRLMSSDLYRGKTLEAVINTYFPASENGSARVESYIDSIIQFASKLGFTVNKSTVPVP
jgi:flagellum-specific peptidoglycan hydrolase FlgJ